MHRFLLSTVLLMAVAGRCLAKEPAKATPTPATDVDPTRQGAAATFEKQVPVPVQRLQLKVVKTENGYADGFLEYSGDDGSKYRICSSPNFFGQKAAELTCKQYGYRGGASRIDPEKALDTNAFKQAGTLSTFTCKPDDTQLKQCRSAPFRPYAACPASDIIFVRCYGEGSLRLVDGAKPTEGRLQILLNGTWINACSKNFANKKNIETTCKLLGFPKANKAKRVPSYEFDGPGRRNSEPNAYLVYINCKGNEDRLTSCTGGDAVMPDDQKACYTAGDDAAFTCNGALGRYGFVLKLVLFAAAAALAIVI